MVLARSQLDDVQVTEQDHTLKRSILRLTARYADFSVLITEIVANDQRKYRYYVLDGDRVVAGFDNAADPRALRAKYGRISQEHVGELIPHLHLEDKSQLVLTEEMDCQAFLSWLMIHLASETPGKEDNVARFFA